jgi:Ca2+/Na+ antiporter
MSKLKTAIRVNKATRVIFVYSAVHFVVNIFLNGSGLALSMNNVTLFIVGPLLLFLTVLNFDLRHEAVNGSKINRLISIVLLLLWLAGIAIGVYAFILYNILFQL